MEFIKPQASSNNLIPLLPSNRLAPPLGYDTLLTDWLNRSRSPHIKRMYRSNIYGFFNKLVQKYAKLAGIDKVMSPHRIRHSAISESLNLTNGDVRKVQKLSRHKKLDTLMIYDDNRTSLQGEITDLLDDLI